MRFLNRADELAALEEAWVDRSAGFFVVWGRRRVGKTELLTHFAEGKRGLYFEATDVAEPDQLRDLSAELARVWGNELLARQPLANWEAALAAIEQFAGERRTVVVLDEFQYLASQQPGLGSLINRWWRTRGRRLPLMLVIAGSAVSFFEHEVLAGQMYGRRTEQLRLLPFDYRAAALFTPRYSAEDKIRAYAVCGGMPYYLERFDDAVPLERNILRHVLYRNGFMHEEAELLLRQELPDPHNHFSVLRAIATGHTRNSQIVGQTGLDSSQVRQTLRVMEGLHLVEQRRPVTSGPASKKTSYAIADGYLAFYFRFVDPYRSLLRTREGAERHLRHTVKPQLDAFVSKLAWEGICREHMREREQASRVGAWWGQVPTGEGRRTEEREVDAVAVDGQGRILATGSCKWTRRPLGAGEEELLNRCQGHIPGAGDDVRHYFYSRAGFSDSLSRLAAADPDRYRLFTPEDLYEADWQGS